MRLPSLSITRPLLAWLREDRQWQTLDWRVRAVLAWKAGLGSLNAKLSRAQQASATSRQPLAPLLILGPWRSGTTVMHELLSAATGWPTPLTWQCMDPTAFQLGSAPRRDVVTARPMDGLALGSLSPQEDEFALLALGAPSAYRAFWMPHRLTSLLPTLEQQYWLDEPQWLDTWEGFLRAVHRGAAPGHGLLLKSPNHTFRLQAILGRHPQARVVWMLRDPQAVFFSNRKMWRTMFAEHGLTPADEAALDHFLARALQASAEALEWALAHLSADQLVCCTQEALRDAPLAEAQRVLAALHLPADEAALEAAIASTRSGRVEHYPQAPPDCAQAAIARLREIQADAAARFAA